MLPPAGTRTGTRVRVLRIGYAAASASPCLMCRRVAASPEPEADLRLAAPCGALRLGPWHVLSLRLR
eukprot:1799267-Rhodomonas_salina.2